MASGESIAKWTARAGLPPVSGEYATPDRRNGHFVLDFGTGTTPTMLFEEVCPMNYALGGCELDVWWSAGDSQTSGNVKWTASVERIDDEGLDTDADSFASGASGTSAAPATAGQFQKTTISLAAGSLDGLQPGEPFRLKVLRDNTVGSNMSGDAALRRLHLREA